MFAIALVFDDTLGCECSFIADANIDNERDRKGQAANVKLV